MFEQIRFAFIGGGNMAEALIKGLLSGLQVPPQQVIATDVVAERRTYLQATYGITALADNTQAVQQSSVVMLAVKPQIMSSILAEIAPVMDDDTLVISIAAGVTLEALQRGLGASRRVVRVMPNTPALVLAGAAGISPGKAATAQDIALVERIFNAVGRAMVVSDEMMDVVTGLSGSGPAFIFALIEGLADGGVLMGLARQTAVTLAAQTVLGAAKMVLETGKHPGELKDMVTSPAGTTIAGMHALESGGLRGLMMEAVRRATERSTALGQSPGH
ncbi:MAG: pyrroline-5-carboxylate reductase [Candidatus Tectomicrobia bacterium]|uniref:Pyrroline-5-carboxylate reductase n=1 Tax=Tectimicrobiota bacterium TaxID=2528274 RepID=A0A938B1P4_UNCTE|nr:pyrroline-5-carboxylate reductase [Candidatus Tectomicrobia bacterium]